MMMPRLRPSRTCALAVVVTLCAACSSTGGSTPQSDDDVIAQALAQAQEDGASSEQVAALEDAVASGSVGIEAARDAARRAVTCMLDAGLDAEYVEDPYANGLVIPGYRVADVDDAQQAQVDACDSREAAWVNMAYQMQPSSVEQNEDYIEQEAPVIRACLEDAGITTDPEATGVDLANQAWNEQNSSGGTVDCLAGTGITSW